MLTPDFRAEIAALLPQGAFLRRDRGGALYVTNAPALGADMGPAAEAWRALGFDVESAPPLMRLTPSSGRILDMERAPAPDLFAGSLRRFAGLPADGAVRAIFAEGVKCLEAGSSFDLFDRRLRQAAALALRCGGGGGLYACALVRYDLLNATRKDVLS